MLTDQVSSGENRVVDLAFARLMARFAGGLQPEIIKLVADLSHSLSQQHSCLVLKTDQSHLIEQLKELSIVGTGATPTPLVLQENRLYLHRYFQCEQRIARSLIQRNRKLEQAADWSDRLVKAFNNHGGTVDWQQMAALQALSRQLTIITGGPGTGKTSTVVKILTILMHEQPKANFTIKMAAPTGKAAARLSESIQSSLAGVPNPARETIPTKVQTIHRLLGVKHNGRGFRHNQTRPVVADLLIVDEVSMVDLTLMDRLLNALSPDTRLILLGDPEQLPSVDTGNVLADICRDKPGYSAGFAIHVKEILDVDIPVRQKPHHLVDAICHLEKNYRFSRHQGIGQLANAIRSGDPRLNSSADDDVQVFGLESLSPDKLRKEISSYYFEYEMLLGDSQTDALTLIESFDQTRILCPMREGTLGLVSLNREMEAHLESRGLKKAGQQFYHGRPILITRNDYQLGLFNGDVGICIRDGEKDQFLCVFLNSAGDLTSYHASSLPPHETCFAMTVHKSQGSEFNHVTLIVPSPGSTTVEQLLTRELVYTAVTRAKDSIAVYADNETWTMALGQSIQRMSGLSCLFEEAQPNEEQMKLF